MSIAIIDYGSGNLRSAAKAVAHVAADRHVLISDHPQALDTASHIILPGVGAFADCMAGLKAVPGMLEALEENVRHRKKPFLGICVGMQMLFERSHEHGVHQGLGWLEGEVVGLRPIPSIQHSASGIQEEVATNNRQPATISPNTECHMPNAPLKVPHMGWNELALRQPNHPLLKNIHKGDHAYFVHSYHALCANADNVLATTEYGSDITAIVAHNNIMGTQFHPEKSQETGLHLLKNFLEIGF